MGLAFIMGTIVLALIFKPSFFSYHHPVALVFRCLGARFITVEKACGWQLLEGVMRGEQKKGDGMGGEQGKRIIVISGPNLLISGSFVGVSI